MGFTGGGVKYRCEIGSAPAPSPLWQPACRSPPQPPVPGSKQAKAALRPLLSSPPDPSQPLPGLLPTPEPPLLPRARRPRAAGRGRSNGPVRSRRPGHGRPGVAGQRSRRAPRRTEEKFLQLFPAAVPTARSQGHCGPPGLPPSRSSPSPRRQPTLAPRAAPAPSRPSVRKLPRGTAPRPQLNPTRGAARTCEPQKHDAAQEAPTHLPAGRAGRACRGAAGEDRDCPARSRRRGRVA